MAGNHIVIQGVENADPPDAAQRAIFKMAFAEGAFGDALNAYQHGLFIRGMALLRAAGYAIAWEDPVPRSGKDMAVAMVAGLIAAQKANGDAPDYTLEIAGEVFTSLAILQSVFERPFDQSPDDRDDLIGELVLAAAHVGTAERLLGLAEGGLYADYAALKFAQSKDQERRRHGAQKTQEIKAQKRRTVLKAAQTLSLKNPTLSTDEMAFKLKNQLQLNETTRTIAGWVRVWRLDGELPPQSR